MEKIKVFVGPPSTGKSRKSRELSNGKDCAFIQGRDRFAMTLVPKCITQTTNLVIVDDIRTKKDLENWIRVFFHDEFVVNRQCEKTFKIPRPEIILICDFEEYNATEVSISHRIEVVDFGMKENQYNDNVKGAFQIEKEVSDGK